jgi:transcription elongation factor Elf1
MTNPPQHVPSRFQCPKCGSWADLGTTIERTDATEFTDERSGQTGLEWTETHRCFCGTEWTFRNANL